MSADARDLCLRVSGLTEALLAAFVEEELIRPERRAGAPVFSETDIARVHLIMDLRATMQVEHDSLSIILALIDQLHDARRQLRLILDQAGPELRGRLTPG